MVSKNSRGPGGSEAEEALLLPEHEVGGNASVLGAVFNVSTSVVGAGIMSIPAAMRVLGVAPALALIVGVALLANVAVDFMLRYTRGTPSYAALMGGSFGRAGAALLNVFIAFNCVGTLTVYLIIIGDVMSGPVGSGEAHAGVLPEWFGLHWWTGRDAVLVAAAVILLPLVLVALTAVLMAALYALAIAIPSIWTLFQYTGSTFAVCISLIFPGAIVLRDVHGIAKRKDKAMASMMITLAVITSSIAIASNIMSSIKGQVKGVHGVAS